MTPRRALREPRPTGPLAQRTAAQALLQVGALLVVEAARRVHPHARCDHVRERRVGEPAAPQRERLEPPQPGERVGADVGERVGARDQVEEVERPQALESSHVLGCLIGQVFAQLEREPLERGEPRQVGERRARERGALLERQGAQGRQRREPLEVDAGDRAVVEHQPLEVGESGERRDPGDVEPLRHHADRRLG